MGRRRTRRTRAARSHVGRGFGRTLIEAVMHALALQGHDTLTLAVTRRNHRARHLYQSLGFAEVPLPASNESEQQRTRSS
ncbi:GNAT family N-acetyltransferase [Actinomadura violacea]|uniref:GNAT family N-acetyltransferase n=1 Tax=Actinomadura violacea TaxID=2819934 RepID=A0ABS3RV75_9ACTN|nr:GNAT family N-acetyltransferase [Actinomadura violacea]